MHKGNAMTINARCTEERAREIAIRWSNESEDLIVEN